nr:MAG TPA: hypothetical protein [Microviridae sp.]
MPFLEKKSFSMPLAGGRVVLPEIQEVIKSVDGQDVTSMAVVHVDQAHKDLPEGKEKLAWSIAGALKGGIPRTRTTSVMFGPKAINLVDADEAGELDNSGEPDESGEPDKSGESA